MNLSDLTQQTTNQYLTPEQITKEFGISIKTLASWRCNNRYKLPYYKFGRKVVYKRSDISEFLDNRKIDMTGRESTYSVSVK